MIPIHAATRGLISNNLPLGIVTDGLICILPPAPPARKYGGGGGVWVREAKIQDMRREEILRDDNEVFEWLCAIMPSLS